MSLTELSDEEEFKSFIAEGLVCVEWTASWCRACKKLKPDVVALAEATPTVKFGWADGGELDELAMDVGVAGLPFFTLYDSGKQILNGDWKSVLPTLQGYSGSSSGSGDAETGSGSGAGAGSTAAADADADATTTTTTTTKKATSFKPSDGPVPPLNVAVFPGNFPISEPSDTDRPDVDGVALAHGINSTIMSLFAKFVTEDGKGVDYAGMGADPLFLQYVNQTAQLQAVKLDALPETELKAFTLNIYNALVMHATVVRGAADASVKGSITAFFRDNAYMIGGQRFSCDDLEHGILRGNQVHPTTGNRFFPDGDVRTSLALKTVDPRIHFALVCGAKSCPPIRVFTPEKLEQALEMAARAFCRDAVSVAADGKTVTLSKLFDWYGKDFAPTPTEVLTKLQAFLTGDLAAQVTAALAAGPTIEFATYDWGSNSSSSAK